MPSDTPKKILVLIGFTKLTGTVLKVAIEMARALHGQLVIVHVGSPDQDADSDEWRTGVSRPEIAADLRRKLRALDKMQAHAKKNGVAATVLLVRSRTVRGGTPTKKIVQEVTRLKPDLIVLGTHRHGLLHTLFHGSAAASVVQSASCPVLLVPAARSHR